MLVGRTGRMGRRIAGVIVAMAILSAAIPSAFAASGSGAIVVRGIQGEYGSCGDSDGYAMTGALVGCWWVDTFDVKPLPVQGTMLATGVEHFTGCLNVEVCGTFYTTYTYTARFDGATELHGRCHHPIVGGTEGFAGASGELSFTDVVDSTPVYYPYWGNIRLDGGASSTTLASSGSSSRTASAKQAATAPC